VILGDAKTASAQTGGQTTLDELFRYAADRRPDAIAIADPPDRAIFTDGPPRRLSYAEADRIISAIAARLRRIGLQTDTVVGIQLPNTIENVLTILGVLRAGMIAAPLPLLWRCAETAPALNRLGAKAIITTSRIGEFDHCDLAMQVAAEVFPIRYVCSFGTGLADGVIALDDLLSADAIDPTSAIERDGKPGDHVALVTWDVTPDGPVAVARNHTQLIAGGLACLLEGGLEQDAAILGCCAMSSFAGLSLTMVPWLLAGGTLSLHHAFDPETFAIQCRDDHCDTLVVPGPLVPQLAAAGLLAHPELKNVLAVWRAPERLLISPAWLHPSAALIDMLVFGEIALLGSRRGADGRPTLLPAGQVRAPHGSPNSVLMAEIERTEAGTMALRGPMVPRHAFPPGSESLAGPHLSADAGGFVDTGYSCRLDPATPALQVTGPPPGIVSVGGYRFVSSELESLISRAGSSAALTALPDALAGHRLAGIAGNAKEVGAALAALGVNPLVAGAFRERRLPKAA
jgi:non-ribosomal peptide synthetase component E (peptide arylation enzyme)